MLLLGKDAASSVRDKSFLQKVSLFRRLRATVTAVIGIEDVERSGTI